VVARPIPVPSNSSTLCSRWNTPNSLCAYRMSKPAPLSRTKNIRRPPSTPATPISISASSRPLVYLIALSMRFANTCRSIAKSPITGRELQPPHHLLDHCAEIHRRLVHFLGAHSRKGQEVGDQLAHLDGGGADGFEVSLPV